MSYLSSVLVCFQGNSKDSPYSCYIDKYISVCMHNYKYVYVLCIVYIYIHYKRSQEIRLFTRGKKDSWKEGQAAVSEGSDIVVLPGTVKSGLWLSWWVLGCHFCCRNGNLWQTGSDCPQNLREPICQSSETIFCSLGLGTLRGGVQARHLRMHLRAHACIPLHQVINICRSSTNNYSFSGVVFFNSI